MLYQSYRDLCCERILGDQSVEITKVFIFVFKEANLRVRVVLSSCGFVLFRFLWELGVEVRPRQASVFVVLVGTREGLVSPRVLV